MASIAAVQTIRNEDGAIDTITIDAKVNPQAVEALQKLGLIEKSPLRLELEANPEKFMTVEDGFSRLKEEVKKSWEEWNNRRQY